MYLEHFKLRSKPFELTPDTRFFFASGRHRVALSVLEYALLNRCILAVLTGEVGCGKTTVLGNLLSRTTDEYLIGQVSTPHEAFGSLTDWVLRAFVDAPGGECQDLTRFDELVDRLRQFSAEGRRPVLVIDEAQNMSESDLEAVRMLTNVNDRGVPMVSVLLVGQPELRRKLRQPHLRQFTQRITADYDLKPLSPEQVAHYIAHRCRIAGAGTRLFTSEAVAMIAERANGIPRVINSLCDLSLVYAFAEDARIANSAIVGEVIREKSEGGLYWLDEPDSPATMASGL